MKKILITGGAGFIGSHTAVVLHESGYVPVIADNFKNSEKWVIDRIQGICQRSFPVYEGDCTDKTFVSNIFDREKDLAGVIHFAAYKAVNESIQYPVMYYKNNLVSLIHLIDVMLEHKVFNLVFSSSCTVYGSPDQVPVTEESPIKETPSTYGKTKQLSEFIIEDIAARQTGLKSVLLRYFNPIGAHPSGLIGELPIGIPNNLVPFITQTAAGIRDQLIVFGNDYNTPDGTCIRDFIHVMDLAQAHIKAFEYLEKQGQNKLTKINVGTGQGNTVLEVIKAFEKVSGTKLNYVIGKRREGDVEAVYANTTKARQVLNWRAEISLEDAMRDAWHWQQCLAGKKK